MEHKIVGFFFYVKKSDFESIVSYNLNWDGKKLQSLSFAFIWIIKYKKNEMVFAIQGLWEAPPREFLRFRIPGIPVSKDFRGPRIAMKIPTPKWWKYLKIKEK
jgi:hypothetical protein